MQHLRARLFARRNEAGRSRARRKPVAWEVLEAEEGLEIISLSLHTKSGRQRRKETWMDNQKKWMDNESRSTCEISPS